MPSIGPTCADAGGAAPSASPVPLDWTSITVTALAAPRPLPADIVRWSGGDIAIGSDTPDTGADTPAGPTRVWTSPDGRQLDVNCRWRPSASTTPPGTRSSTAGLPAATGSSSRPSTPTSTTPSIPARTARRGPDPTFPNVGNGTLVGRGGVVVADTETPQWWHGCAGPRGLDGLHDLAAGGAARTKGGIDPGSRRERQRVSWPWATAAAASQVPTQPLAWYSTDGLHWSSATVPSSKGDGLLPWLGGLGRVSGPERQPGRHARDGAPVVVDRRPRLGGDQDRPVRAHHAGRGHGLTRRLVHRRRHAARSPMGAPRRVPPTTPWACTSTTCRPTVSTGRS